MLKDAIQTLKLDRRLVHRRGWIEGSETEAALEALPDVAEKGRLGGEDDEADAPAQGSPPDPASTP